MSYVTECERLVFTDNTPSAWYPKGIICVLICEADEFYTDDDGYLKQTWFLETFPHYGAYTSYLKAIAKECECGERRKRCGRYGSGHLSGHSYLSLHAKAYRKARPIAELLDHHTFLMWIPCALGDNYPGLDDLAIRALAELRKYKMQIANDSANDLGWDAYRLAMVNLHPYLYLHDKISHSWCGAGETDIIGPRGRGPLAPVRAHAC